MVSVIMSVYKEDEEWLQEAIESILKQTYNDLEFIITLDNPDNFKLKEILIKYSKNDSRIKLIFNNTNKGLVYCLNNMLKSSKGEYIARMDADDIAFPSRIEKQLIYMKENDIDLLGSNTINFNETIEYTNKLFLLDKDIKTNIGNGAYIPHPTWLVRRKVYEDLNGYRDINSAEDYDFILRTIKKGYKIGNYSKPLLKYRINNNSISRKNALKQKLTSIYLFENFDRIDEVEKDEINNIIIKVNNKQEEKYSKGEKLFYCYKQQKNKVIKFYILLKLLFRYSIYLKYNKFRNIKESLKK